ncbi:MAG: porin [Planctomycetaceae bacterium]
MPMATRAAHANEPIRGDFNPHIASEQYSFSDASPHDGAGCSDSHCNGSGCDDFSCDDWACEDKKSNLPWGFRLGGWVDAGFTVNSRDPLNPRGGFGNLPVSFNYRDRELQLNQLYLFAERETDGANGLDVGGRLDVLYGEDYIFTQAAGLETRPDFSGHWNDGQGSDKNGINGSSRNGLAMPQAYVELAYGKTKTKLGHFYTIIGYETVTAPDNFFYSHAYTMQYGEPFTHTGALTTYEAFDRLKLFGGIVNGWDKFDAVSDRASFLGGFSWTLPNEQTVLNYSLITGDEDGSAPPYAGNRTMYSVVLNHEFNDRWQAIVQHDLGVQQNGVAAGTDAEWYGLNTYLFRTLTDKLKAGMRYEWFNDDDGTRVVNEAGVFQELATGINWTPCDHVMFRPEARWDWFDPDSDTAPPGPYDNFSTRSQFTFGVDAIITL